MLIESCHILGLSCLALISPSYVWASSASLDFTDSVIVTPPELERLERRAIAVLREEIQKRTGVQLSTSTEWPKSQQSVIAVGQTGQMKILANPYSNILENGQTLGKEGFRLSIKENAIFVSGNDPRGVLYGVGELLRTLRMKPDSITSPNDVYITTSPRYPIRGHQLGYRPKTNAYDAWSPAQFGQYIRELALFGANSIEIIPPRSDDAPTSPHMKLAPMEMMIKQAEIIDSYGMDVWIWYPNMGRDYAHPDSIPGELQERDEIFKKMKRIDAVFVPGGDPGDGL